MAKKRKRANAVPKRIAGMKVPKALRRGRIGQLLASPAGQALLIQTVARAGEHLIARETRPGSTVRTAAARSQDAAEELGEGAAESGAAFAYALRQAARAFVTAMQAQQQRAREPGGPEREPERADAGEARLEKKDRGERPDHRTAH